MRATFALALATVFLASVYATVVCPPQNGPDVTLLANPKDCKTYYSCNDGIPYLMFCEPGLHFNAELRVCDWPEHARCETPPSPATPTASTTTAPSAAPSLSSPPPASS